MSSDLRKCDLLVDWREVAQERGAWRGVVRTMSEILNNQLEATEKERKDDWKMRKETGT